MSSGFTFSLAKGRGRGQKAPVDEPLQERSVFEELAGSDSEEDEDAAVVPVGAKRHFAQRQVSTKAGPGSLGPLAPMHMQPHARQATSVIQPPVPSNQVVALASNLPPGTSTEQIADLFKSYETLAGPTVTEEPAGPQLRRPSQSMKVVFPKKATSSELNKAISDLSNDKCYLHSGYYLHLDRYIIRPNSLSNRSKLPYGAEYKDMPGTHTQNNGGHHREMGPAQRVVVRVERPTDFAALRLINMTAESIVNYGPGFEAALKKDERTMKERRFAWLYDQHHKHAAYFRWTIYRLITNSEQAHKLYGNVVGEWIPPRFPRSQFSGTIADLDPMEAVSSDEDDDDARPGRIRGQVEFLYSITRAELLWQLSNLKHRIAWCSDIAGTTTTCMEHADENQDELVEILVTNIMSPFMIKKMDADANGWDGRYDRVTIIKEATFNALRIVSDLAFLSNKSNALDDSAKGSAYRFRTMIGQALADRHVFDYVGNLPAELNMALTSKKSFREDVEYILDLWDEEKLFDFAIREQFREEYNQHVVKQEEVVPEVGLAEWKTGMEVSAVGDDPVLMDVDDVTPTPNIEDRQYANHRNSQEPNAAEKMTAMAGRPQRRPKPRANQFASSDED